ncbi:unnamed protein product [Clavelina lepadiformis]|uniref:FMP27/BLTP2/Hobbit GFWDK motif-containing RBG unit domain-containing protein n=1 Tax=Clavelina lepadiformis TaxID=159417 RepID=A0ABP0H638_CLALP
MWSIIYGLLALFVIWLSVRMLLWQAARWVKAKFDVDIAIGSTGLFSASDVTVRVNQLQTVEIDKVALQLNPFNKNASHLVSLHLGEVRVRAEMKTGSSESPDVKVTSTTVTKQHRSNSFSKRRDTLMRFVEKFFKNVSVHLDVLNIMLLNAFVPDSLLHINIQRIHLESEKSFTNSSQINNTALAGNFSVGCLEGKILKSPKEATEVTSCIAEISTSFEVVVLAKYIHPMVDLASVNIDFSQLQIEIHEGALIPGIFLPSVKPDHFSRKNKSLFDAAKTIENIQDKLHQFIQIIPVNSIMCVRSFGLSFFGDETMGETTRGAHVCSSKLLFTQFKDISNMVPVAIKDLDVEDFTVPSGYVRLQVDDVTMTDYYKHKVATMGKTVLESKLTPNGVLSNSFDFTSWHADYMHKESVEFWMIILNKLQDAQRQKTIIQQSVSYSFLPDDSESLNASYPVVRRRPRAGSLPNANFRHSHPDILLGTEKGSLPITNVENDVQNHKELIFNDILKKIDISVVFECTVYDASIIAIMTPMFSNQFVDDNPPSFTIGLDSFTGSIDQSPHTKDLNFMSKMEHFWCKVSQDGNRSNAAGCDASHLSPPLRHGVHQWGQAFNVESLSLHGSANIKSTFVDKPSDVQEISLLIDAKVTGLQLEASKCAAQAIVSFLHAMSPLNFDTSVDSNVSKLQKIYRRQTTTPDGYYPPQVHPPMMASSKPKYRYSVTCVELELTDVNAFILSSDETHSADCFVARIDQLKADISGNDANLEDDGVGIKRSISIAGFAIGTVHNPFFSAFAAYEAGLNGGRTPTAKIPENVRHQQTIAAEYQCVESAYISPKYMSVDLLEVCYSTTYDNIDNETKEMPMQSLSSISSENVQRVRRQLEITISSEKDITVRWTPTLHALVHYEITDFFTTLSPFFKKKSKPMTPKSTPYELATPSGHVSNDGDHKVFAASSSSAIRNISMCGDGQKKSIPLRCLEVNANVTAVVLHITLSQTQSVQFSISPFRCEQSDQTTSIFFDELRILMDRNEIFSFTSCQIDMCKRNDVCVRDRQSFTDLKTASNRCWVLKLASLKCHFPHQYDFANTFDQTVTTFKWVKGLYRKISHPFRSPRLPPDLLLNIGQFTFEIADWAFESYLHDNHELMKDEWAESEKRRRVLDQRMAELRRKRGELLSAKKVEELYCRLEEENTQIYLNRCHDLHGFDSPPTHAMPHNHQSINTNVKTNSTNFIANPYEFGLTNTILFSWSLLNVKMSVLADETMHGMDNAMNTIKSIDNVAPFPFKNEKENEPDFNTLWCRNICLHAGKHQVRLRNYPQCLMDYVDWNICGKLCGAEQEGLPSAKRTEYVQLPAPWGHATVNRNMPALKFYHDLSSKVQTFNMAWGPCWDPAWSQVNLAFNLLTKMSIDPSPQLPWWDKSRLLFHGQLAMSMDRVNMLHLASLDPYNTTEHMLWDWKNMYMDWTPGKFLFQGDLDIHIRNASKYDDIRFLHLPHLKMLWSFDWVCLDGANPNDHHAVMPSAPDKLEGDAADHDTYCYFRSRNIDLSISMDIKYNSWEGSNAEGDGSKLSVEEKEIPQVLLYSTTLRWLGNFWYAINAVARPICKGAIFNNITPPKLKLSRHYRNVKISFDFPQLKVRYWSSYAQQIGVEWLCGTGKVASHFRLRMIPCEANLIRRNIGEWSIISTTCDLSDTKIYLLKRQEVDEDAKSPSNRSLGAERNFLLSLSKMMYHRDNVPTSSSSDGQISPTKTLRRNGSEIDETKYRKKKQRKPTSPTKKPQNRHTLVIHDLRAMWTTDNRDVGYGLYEGYNKAAVLRRNLSTKVLSKFRIETGQSQQFEGTLSRKPSQVTPNSEIGPAGSFTQKAMDPNQMLRQLLAEPDNKYVGAEDPTTEQQQLKGVTASKLDDVVNQNWLIKFVNCQAMLKGPQTQGYMIMTASQADFLNRDHRVSWRDGQLTTKSSWVGSLSGTQVFATVERNVTSSGQEDENVPWLSVSDIAPRGPSPGMLDLNDLMGGGQAIGGVVGDGVSAGSFQLQRIVSRCTCHMYYVGYEALVDSEQSDYGKLLPETPVSPEDDKMSPSSNVKFSGSDLLGKEKPINILTILQPELEICTNTSQFTMIIDIVENLLLHVEPVMREHWERVERMRYKLRLTSADNAAKHRDTLAAMQSCIRTRLTNMRQLERQLFRADRALDNDPGNRELNEECSDLRHNLAEEKETLNLESEELGIIIRCFKEMFLEEKTKTSSLRLKNQEQVFDHQDDELAVVRTTEVSFGQVKWHLTDADGQLNIAQFEMRDFLYEKINRSDDSVSHSFELAWLRLQNLLPNSMYRDVIKPRQQMGLRSYGVSGAGGRSLTLRVLCRVRSPVGGIPVKEHVEVNAVPLTIQLTYQFFKRLMAFFFPDKGVGNTADDDDHNFDMYSDLKDSKNATLLGLPARGSQQERSGSMLSLPVRPPPPSPSISTSSHHRRNRSSGKRDRSALDTVDDVEKMKERAANNNSFLYIKITQVPLCVSYKGEKEKNLGDVHDFDITIPMLEYHNMTWTWHDFAMAVKRDCKGQLLSQVIKKKLHITGQSSQPASSGAGEVYDSSATTESSKAKLLLGNTLKQTESHRKSIFRKKK